jgi:hypothetical protein
VSANVPQVLCDSQDIVALAHNPVLYAHTEQLELDFIICSRRCQQTGLTLVTVQHIPGQDQFLDLLSMSVCPTRFCF